MLNLVFAAAKWLNIHFFDFCSEASTLSKAIREHRDHKLWSTFQKMDVKLFPRI
jgi:hypothetical protein